MRGARNQRSDSQARGCDYASSVMRLTRLQTYKKTHKRKTRKRHAQNFEAESYTEIPVKPRSGLLVKRAEFSPKIFRLV